MTMPKVSVVVPVYNEVGMLDEIAERVHKVFTDLKDYDYELVFFDDGSSDGTCRKIEELAEAYPEVKGVFYSRNIKFRSTGSSIPGTLPVLEYCHISMA